ncbi:uncharacterized protein ACR2FA_011681 [Aphomia sociella]
MNVARLRVSHMTKGDKIRLLGKMEKATKACCQKYGVLDWPVATCIDLKTCIVRTGILEENTNYINIKCNTKIILSYELSIYDKCNDYKIFVDNPFLTVDVKVGMEISIGQDEIVVQCIEIIDDKSIRCVVIKDGDLYNMSYVSVRGAKYSRPLLTEKDIQIIKFALEYQESDGILLSREFLPYELDNSKKYRMNQIQKWVGAKCQLVGKPYYISGGVFQDALLKGDFRENEIGDITNALLDGASGFVLKDCEDVDLVIATVKAMNEVCCYIEPLTTSKTNFLRITDELKPPINAAQACVLTCAMVANQTNTRVVIIPTVTGQTAKALLWMTPSCLVITVSSKTRVTRLLHTYRCVIPLKYTGYTSNKEYNVVEAKVQFAVEYAVKRGWLQYGDTYITLQRGAEDSSFCDMVRIWKVTIAKKALVKCAEHDEIEE